MKDVFCCMLQLAGGVILGVALWLRHDPKTSNLLELEFDGAHAPSTFYISMYLICCVNLFKWKCSPRLLFIILLFILSVYRFILLGFDIGLNYFTFNICWHVI